MANTKTEQPNNKTQIWLRDLHKHLDNHLPEEKLSVALLAKKMHCSPRQLQRLMKTHTGQNPSDYLKDYRLQKAKQHLLNRTFDTIAETARHTGYEDAEYFARIFRERFGVLPSEVSLTRYEKFGL